MRKRANGFTDAFKETIKSPMFIGSMLAGGVTLGASKIEDFMHRRGQQQQKVVAYKQMLDLHPHLKERDPGEISRVYNSLHNVSPHMARDPMVAGAWVDQIVELKTPGQNSHHALLNAVKDLSGIQKNMLDIEQNTGPSHALSKLLGKQVETFSSAYGEGQKARVEAMRNARKDDFEGREKALEQEGKKWIKREKKERKELLGIAQRVEADKQQINAIANNLIQREQALSNQVQTYNSAFNQSQSVDHLPQRPLQRGQPRHIGMKPKVRPFDARPGLVPKTASASNELRDMLRALRV